MYLRALQIKNRKSEIIYDVQFLTPNKEYGQGPLTSIIIGANGAGKSFLLAQITDLFAHCDNKSHKWRYDYYHAEIVDGKEVYDIVVDKQNPKNNINNLPKSLKILAVSYVLNDKFLFQKRDPKLRYQYLGVRQSSNAAFTTDLERQIIEILLDLDREHEKLEGIKRILKYINWEEKISLKIFFKPSIQKKINSKGKNLIDERLKALDRSTKYRSLCSLINDNLGKILFWENELQKKGCIQFNLLNSDIKSFDVLSFRFLNALGLINYELNVQKQGEVFSLAWAASGEKQLLFTCLNILAHINSQSIVLIDEPEISLHPNWQMGYIQLLKNLFKNYNCHFILATHSHYLVSDADAHTSSIIRLRREKKHILSAHPEDINTYAWSAENVLYEVFDVVTTRNRFVAEELAEILEELSSCGQSVCTIDAQKKEKLKHLQITLKDVDPLKAVVEGLLSKIG